MATLDTPRRKDYGVDAETLLARWRVEAAAAGFDARRFEACFGRAAVEAVTDTQVARLYERLGGPAGLTERASTFVRTDVIESIANAVVSAGRSSSWRIGSWPWRMSWRWALFRSQQRPISGLNKRNSTGVHPPSTYTRHGSWR